MRARLAIGVQVILIMSDVIVVHAALLLSYLTVCGSVTRYSGLACDRDTLAFLTLIHVLSIALFGGYRRRFKSSWDVFKVLFGGLSFATVFSIVLIFAFRGQGSVLPMSVPAVSFLPCLVLLFQVHQFALGRTGMIRKHVVILGDGHGDEALSRCTSVTRKEIGRIRDLFECETIDEIVVTEKPADPRDLALLCNLRERFKAEILFSPAVYSELLPARINGGSSLDALSTFVGRRPELDEVLIRLFDIVGSIAILLLFWPFLLVIAVAVKVSSRGPIIYSQRRVGKDGRTFTLYKYRSMYVHDHKRLLFAPAGKRDPRVTPLGRFLRRFHLDELPQLVNVLRGDMCLVGPRPENLHRLEKHKSLQGLRLSVKPGITGLAQIRRDYDLTPEHKVRYDYLYIQRRSLPLNLYILLLTIPAILSKKGW